MGLKHWSHALVPFTTKHLLSPLLQLSPASRSTQKWLCAISKSSHVYPLSLCTFHPHPLFGTLQFQVPRILSIFWKREDAFFLLNKSNSLHFTCYRTTEFQAEGTLGLVLSFYRSTKLQRQKGKVKHTKVGPKSQVLLQIQLKKPS